LTSDKSQIEIKPYCPKCKSEMIMIEIFYMAWFGCSNCNSVFYSNGYDYVESKSPPENLADRLKQEKEKENKS
jgi:ribosomal protein L37AE/L43A